MGEAEDLIRELRDALKPFAEEGLSWHPSYSDDQELNSDRVPALTFRLGELRRAAEVVARADAALNSGG